MTIAVNCGDIPPLEINPETGLAYNAALAVTLLYSYVNCMQSATDGEIDALKLDIKNLGTSLVSLVGNMIAKAIADSETNLRTEINNAVEGVRQQSQAADQNLQNQIDTNRQISDLVDTQLFNYSQALHNQQQGYIDSQDQNIFNQAVNFTNSQINQVYDFVTGQVNNIYSDIETVYNFAADIVDKIGKFIDDPLGWLLKFLTDVFIPWALDEIAELIAPDKDDLPPREDYKKLFANADLI